MGTYMMTADEPLGQVAFDYIKGNFFRVAHVDGVIGAVTPSGMIHFAAYAERSSIPQHMVQEISEDGKLGPEIPSLTVNRNSIVRELEVDLVMTVNVAMALRDWLNNQIELIEERNLNHGNGLS